MSGHLPLHRTYGFFFLATLAALTVVASLVGAEVLSRVEVLEKMMRTGQVEEARAGFGEYVETGLEAVESLLEEPTTNDLQLVSSVAELTWLADSLQTWEIAEVRLQERGGQTPDTVRQQVRTLLLRVEAGLRRLEARIDTQGIGHANPQEVAQSISSAKKRIGRDLLRTALFVEDSATADERQELLDRARPLTETPATLEKLETLRDELLERSKGGSSPSPEPRASRSLAPADEARLREVIETFYRALFEGDLTKARGLLDPGTASAVDLREVHDETRGWSLVDLGSITVRSGSLDSSRGLRVSLEGLRLKDESGQEVVSRNELTLTRIGDRYCIKEF